MFELIHKIYAILNELKGFEAGYNTANGKEMLIKHEDEVYRVSFERLGKGELRDHMDTL